MQVKDRDALRKSWGDKPCDHPDFSKEYYLGAQTGDYVCTQCGRTFDPAEVEAIERDRSK